MPVVESDILCQRCAYNLRGLNTEGTCPECGAPVAVALHGDRLDLADPRWLQRVATGSRRFRRAGIVFFFLPAVRELVGLLMSLLPTTVGELLQVIVLVTGLVVYALMLQGLWLIATPHERLSRDTAIDRQRQLFRAGIVLFPVTLGFGISLAVSGSRELSAWVVMIGSPFGMVGAIAAWGFCGYVEYLAIRSGDEFATGRSRVYRRLFLFSWLMAAGGMIPLLATGKNGFLCLAIPGAVGVLGFGILVLWLVDYVAASLESAARDAEIHWRTAPKK